MVEQDLQKQSTNT